MKRKWVVFIVSVLIAMPLVVRAVTNDLNAALQRGLFEEEANHNLDAAIQAYQSVINQYDKDRKLAATAIFQLGESYRKQAKTNEAIAQYERVLREFLDQPALVPLSQQNLVALGGSGKKSQVLDLSEALNAKAQLERLSNLGPAERRIAVQQEFPNPVLTSLMQQLGEAEQHLAAAQKDYGPQHPEVQKAKAVEATITKQIDAQVGEVLASLRFKQSAAGSKLGSAQAETAGSAAEAEEVNRIQALIKESPDLINSSDSTGETLLQRAAAKGETAVVRLLLDWGAAVNGVKRPGLTALHYAAGNGHKAVVDLLLSRGAKTDAPSESGVTPLHLAALKGYGLVAKTLLEAGAAVNARTDQDVGRGAPFSVSYSLRAGQTPLHAAAASGFSAMVELLVSKGADVNVQDAKGRTPMSYAAERRDAAMARTLLAAHADPNAGRTDLPLQYAAWNGDTVLMELLLGKGANPNTNTYVNWFVVLSNGQNFPQGGAFSPLLLAISQRHPEAVRLLTRFKADPNAGDNFGNSLIFDALPDPDTLNALVEGGANPNAPDSAGVSPLERALRAGSQAAAEMLLAHGADPKAVGQYGWTPLHSAADLGNTAAAALLLQKGADVNAIMNDGNTPLHLAVRNNHKEIVSLLLTNKADPNLRNNSGYTPLHEAVMMKHDAVAKLLLENKADPNFRDNSGKTPLDLAKTSMRGPPPVSLPGRAGVPQGPARIGLGTPAPNRISDEPLPQLLRKYGAMDDLPRPEIIQLRRPSRNFSDELPKGTNNWNRFTLLEILAMESGLLTKVPQGERQEQVNQNVWINSPAAYPDLEKVRIKRPRSDLKSWQEQTVDIRPVLDSGDCSKNVSLEWGDVIEVPETDHPLNEPWPGFTTNQWANLIKCLSRTVEIIVKGHSTKVMLAPEVTFDSKHGVRTTPGGQNVLFTTPLIILTTAVPFWIKPSLRKTDLLLASSDLSHVKVTRRDPQTGKKHEWVLDFSDSQPAPDFWLRDGDVIEVPDKS